MKKALPALILVMLLILLGYYFFPEGEDPEIIVIGLDAANWKVLKPLLEKDKLPNFERMIKKGYSADLIPEIPSSAPSWTSIATGCKSDKHGVTGFTRETRKENQLLRYRIKSTDIKIKRFWEVLEDHKKNYGVANWLFSKPFPDVGENSFMISNLDTSVKFNYKSKPPSLFPEVLKSVSSDIHVLDSSLKRTKDKKKSWKPSEVKSKFRHRDSMITSRYAEKEIFENATFPLLKKYPDLEMFAVNFYWPDTSQHLLWKFLEPSRYKTGKEESQRYSHLIPELYQSADKYIGRIMDRYENSNIFIISDHGTAGVSPDTELDLLWWGYYLHFDLLLSRMGLAKTNGGKKAIKEKSPVYTLGSDSERLVLTINKKGRNPSGFVSEKRYNSLKRKLLNLFRNCHFLNSDKKPFYSVKEGEGMEDIVISDFQTIPWKNRISYLQKTIVLGEKKVLLRSFSSWKYISGIHSEQKGKRGILLACGPEIKQVKSESEIMNYNLLPTWMYLLDLPVARDIDGEIIKEMITGKYLKSHAAEYVETYGKKKIDKKKKSKPLKKEGEYLDRLRGLGYIK